METSDYYAVLGISPTAPAAEVKSAYHRAAKRAHPDAGGSTALMQRINEAYQVLSDPLARRDYDARRGTATAHRPAAPHPAHRHNPAPPAARPAAGADSQSSARPAAGAASHGAYTTAGTHAAPGASAQPGAGKPTTRRRYSAYPGNQALNRAYSQIRFMAAERLKAWVPLSVISYFVVPHLAPYASQAYGALLLYAVGFVPIYGFILCLVFLISPEIRLNLYRSVHPRATRADREDYIVTLGVGASFILFAGAWLLFNLKQW